MDAVRAAPECADADAAASSNTAPARRSDAGARLNIWRAVRRGRADLVREHLESGVKFWVRTSRMRRTLMHFAALMGHACVIRALREFSPGDAEKMRRARDVDGSTPLHLAAQRGRQKALECLLQIRGGVDAEDNLSYTPLLQAARGGHEAAVRALLARGADPYVPDEYNRDMTALHYCARYCCGAAEIYADLLGGAYDSGLNFGHEERRRARWPFPREKVASFETTASERFRHYLALERESAERDYCWGRRTTRVTLLHCAASNRSPKAVAWLIARAERAGQKEACVNAEDFECYTPLMYAAENSSPRVAAMLIENGADVRAQCCDSKFTPLHCAAKKNRIKTALLLVEKGADHEATCRRGHTAQEYLERAAPGAHNSKALAEAIYEKVKAVEAAAEARRRAEAEEARRRAEAEEAKRQAKEARRRADAEVEAEAEAEEAKRQAETTGARVLEARWKDAKLVNGDLPISKAAPASSWTSSAKKLGQASGEKPARRRCSLT